MQKNPTPCYYGDYLQLGKLLDAQQPQSALLGKSAHDETLFIIVHQAYELWFKQIIHELQSVKAVFAKTHLASVDLSLVVHRLKRIVAVQTLLNQQVEVLETMTPQDFLSFRDYLVPASGFQSIQFKQIEIGLGLKQQFRIDFDQASFLKRLSPDDQQLLLQAEREPSLFEMVDAWLSRMPFLEQGEFRFWQWYQQSAEQMLDNDQQMLLAIEQLSDEEKQLQLNEIARNRAKYQALVDQQVYGEYQQQGQFRLSFKAMQAAVFISLYQEQPIFNLPFQLLTCLTEIDEKLTVWRYKHAMMVQRMLGTRMGTGGSSGHDYLKKTTENNRIFIDLFHMATFLLAKEDLPPLPEQVSKALGFYFE